MKRNVMPFLILIAGLFNTCASVQPMSESTRLFMEETKLSPVLPLSFYTWIKVENAKKLQNDIFGGFLDFEFDSSADFLLKTYSRDNKLISVWGNQLLLQNEDYRQLVFTPFLMAIYALEKGQDPFDVSFEALKQILSDDSGYKIYEKELIAVFQEGLKQYRKGGAAWSNFKNDHFIVDNKTIIIK